MTTTRYLFSSVLVAAAAVVVVGVVLVVVVVVAVAVGLAVAVLVVVAAAAAALCRALSGRGSFGAALSGELPCHGDPGDFLRGGDVDAGARPEWPALGVAVLRHSE